MKPLTQKFPELCKLALLILTDGYLQKRGNSWRIGFYSQDIELIKLFKKLLFTTFQMTANVRRTKRCWVVEKTAKEFGVFRDIFGSLSTKSETINLEPLTRNLSKQEILRIVFSTEGTVSPSFKNNELIEIRILFTSKSKCFRKFVRNLLHELGIETREYQDDVVIRKINSVKKFYKKIGFIKGVKIRKSSRWRGFEKDNFLREMLRLYAYYHPTKLR